METKRTNYKGVRWRKNEQRFVSSITFNGKLLHCGTCKNDREAARLRDLAIIKYGLSLNKLQVLKPKEQEKQ